MTVTGLKSIVLTSPDPARTARFYVDVLAMPFEHEEHAHGPEHWACRCFGLHWAIHRSNEGASDDRTLLTFAIEDAEAFVEHLGKLGVPVVERREIGPMRFVTFADPDGRRVSCGTSWRGG
jgi:catechol 2,3-dioxygenase-like lactoylglutathione lyase family enzyme